MKLHALSSDKATLPELSLAQIKHQQAETPDETCCSTLSSCEEEGSCADLGRYLSGIFSCIMQPIYQLLAALGLYALPDAEAEKVREFIAWAKSPDSTSSNIVINEAAKDPDQWKAQFEKLPLDAQHYVMRALYNLDPNAGYLFAQQSLSKKPYEDESDQMFYQIEEGLSQLVFQHPGWEIVISELESWILKDQDERVVRNPLTPDERVKRFCAYWKASRDEAQSIPEFCTWRECYMTLPDLAKDCARRAFQKFNPNPLIPALPELPEKGNKAAYNQYLATAVILDSLIIRQKREPQVMLALDFWRGPILENET